MPEVSENNLKRAVIDYLVRVGALVIRVNSGAVNGEYQNRSGQTKTRFFRFAQWFGLGVSISEGQAGISDILALIPADPVAIPIAIETKLPGNKPTLSQERFMAEWRQRGGVVVVAYSVDDVIEAIAELRRRCVVHV